MIPLIYAAAAAAVLKVAIPTFETQDAPGILASRLPEDYAASLESAQCAAATPAGKFGPQTTKALTECENNGPCLAAVAKIAGFDLVVVGRVIKLDDEYTIRLKLLDVHDATVRDTLETHHRGSLRGLSQTVHDFAPTLCKALNPNWVDPAKKAAEQKLSSLDFDTGTTTTPAPAAPTPPVAAPPAPQTPPARAPTVATTAPQTKPDAAADFADLPPLPPEPPATPSTTRAAPVVMAPTQVSSNTTTAAQPPPTPSAARPPPQAATSSAPLASNQAPNRATPTPPPSQRWLLAGPQSPRARTVAFVAIGATGVAAILAGAFGGSALSALTSRSNATTEDGFYAAQSSMQSRALASNVAIGVAGVALVSSVVLWLKGDALFHQTPAAGSGSP